MRGRALALILVCSLGGWAQPPAKLKLFLKSNHPGTVIEYLKPVGDPPELVPILVGATDKEFELDVSDRKPDSKLDFLVRPDQFERRTQPFMPLLVSLNLRLREKDAAKWRQEGVHLEDSRFDLFLRVDPPGASVYTAGPAGYTYVGRTYGKTTLDKGEYTQANLKQQPVTLQDMPVTLYIGGPVEGKDILPYGGYSPRLAWKIEPWTANQELRPTGEGADLKMAVFPDAKLPPEALLPAPGAGAMLARWKFWAAHHVAIAATVGVLALIALIVTPTFLIPALRRRKAEQDLQRRRFETLKNVDISRDPLLGQPFGQWTTTRRLGAGGMAVVYYGIPTETWNEEESVAIKVMNADIIDDEEYRKRFEREINISKDLDHPHIVRLIDWGNNQGRLYLVMEYVRGGTLRDKIPKTGLPPIEALDLLRGMSSGLSHAHKMGVVHRDLKPDNIMLNHHGQVKIMDLGLAKRDENKTAITKTGDTFGTPAYMAPEQIAGGGAPDPRTDQYAVGVISFELFTGRRPFEEEDSLQMIMKHLQEMPPSLREFKPNLPQALADVVNRMLAKDPSQRYPNMLAACSAVEEALKGV